MTDGAEATSLVELSADMVAAYVTNNHIQRDELPALIATIHAALKSAATGVNASEPPKPEPVVPPNKSVRPDHIVCLFDGKKFKSLKRHLRTHHNLTPQEYRAAFDLRPDYPMVAPAYAKTRSELALATGLGQKGRRAPASEAGEEASQVATEAPSERRSKVAAKRAASVARKSAKVPSKGKGKAKGKGKKKARD
jgi:predicted transcriptional regulator